MNIYNLNIIVRFMLHKEAINYIVNIKYKKYLY